MQTMRSFLVRCSAPAITLGPDDSFLRPEPYSFVHVPRHEIERLFRANLPSLCFDSDLSIVLSQPIYGDRIYLSYSYATAKNLQDTLADVYPISPNDPLPIGSL